jgi:hypothetical protein
MVKKIKGDKVMIGMWVSLGLMWLMYIGMSLTESMPGVWLMFLIAWFVFWVSAIAFG